MRDAEKILFEPNIIGLLKSGNISNAVHLGRRRMHVTGHPISTYSNKKPAKIIQPEHLRAKMIASLLFPLHESDRRKITSVIYVIN